MSQIQGKKNPVYGALKRFLKKMFKKIEKFEKTLYPAQEQKKKPSNSQLLGFLLLIGEIWKF
jgi:hypothetical protein